MRPLAEIDAVLRAIAPPAPPPLAPETLRLPSREIAALERRLGEVERHPPVAIVAGPAPHAWRFDVIRDPHTHLIDHVIARPLPA